EEAGASRGPGRSQGGLLIPVLTLSICRVGPSKGSVTLTKTLPPDGHQRLSCAALKQRRGWPGQTDNGDVKIIQQGVLLAVRYLLLSGGAAINRQLLAMAGETHFGRWFADVARDRKRDCLSACERRHETEWRIGLACLQCYDKAMAVGLHRVIGHPRERAEVDFLSLDRLERIGVKRAAENDRGDCCK